MAFPALIPSARTYVPGNVPQVQQVALSGSTVAYRQGNRRVEQTLQLAFNNISEADLDLIKAHYVAQDGTYGIFFLSGEVWNGYDSPPVPIVADYAWRYASPPVITDGSCDLWSVEVELTTYAIDLGDVIFNAADSASIPAREYILNAGGAAASPARILIVNGGASA
jgi:hypothetical protein